LAHLGGAAQLPDADFGVAPGDITAIVLFLVVTVAATALGWLGLRREVTRTAASV
jgi:hypothetical protein